MKKFITLLLLCLTGMAAWATDIENVAFKNDAGMYLNAAVANDAVSVGTTSQDFSIKAVSGEEKAYQLYCNDISRWINSGSNGYLSSATAQTNARYFYFYEVTMSSTSLVMASPVATPSVGKKYVVVVKNVNGGTTSGYYAIYGQLANGKTNRLDVVNKLSDELPSTIMLTSATQTSNGTADLTKVVWTVEQLTAPEPPVDVTKTYYLKDTGISQYVVIPTATGSSANITPSTTDKTAVKFAAVTGGYSIQDATTGNYIGISSWYAVSSTTAQPWAIDKVEGGITIKNTSGSYAGSYFGGQSGKAKFYNNNGSPIVFALEEAGAPAPATKECPQCSEAVDIDATVCPKCGYVFESAPASAVTNLNATFSNTGTSWAGVNISVAATDADGNAVSGVTATVTGNTAPKTVSEPGTNCIVINKNSKDMSNEPLNFTISGLPEGSKFNRINLPMYAINGSGSFQQNAGQSDVTFKVTVIEGGNTLYENTITNFNVPQIQKGNLNDLLVYECGEDIVTNGGDVQVNFSMSKGSVNNGMCMAFQSLKLYYIGAVEYTVNVTGATGSVTYDGHTYNNGDKITATGLTVADLTATPVEGYTYNITIDGTVINIVYKENVPTAGKVYTIKAWFSNANPVYLTNAGGTTLTFPESVQGAIPEAAQGAKGYWVARESNGTYAWKLQSGYGDGRYLDGNVSGGGISATGFEIDINEIAGTPYYSMYTNLTGKGTRYVGTWCASHAPGFGLYGGAFGMSHSDATWTTKYIIEPVPNVTAYNVVCATADGGIAPAFTDYTGATNVKNGGVIVVPNGVEINSTNFPVLPVTGYEGSVSASGNTITVTYVMTSIPVDVTYTFTIDGETIGTKTITEFQGEASTVASVIPSYVEATGIPATVEQDAYTIETSYTGLPFEVGKKYAVSIIGGGVKYWLYANASNTVVKESTTKQTGSDYEWTVGGDWLNGFSFVNGSGYYIAAPSATPANGNNTTVATTDGALTRFDLVQNGTYGYRFMPHGGSNYIAHTSASSKNLGFFDYYGRDASYNSGNSLLFEEAGLEVTIGTTGFATFYDEVDRVIPTDVTAYYCEESVSGYLKPEEITTGVIPAYVGVVLEGTPGTYVLNEGDGTAEYIDESCLEGVTEDYGTQDLIDMYETYFEVTPNIYVFSKKDDVLGFYKYVGTTLGAHKAFYVTVPEAGVNGFIIDFSGIEGVNSVISATNLKAGYDIQGRRINKMQKGINILNGKKIIK